MATSHFIDLDGPVHYVDHGGTGRPMVLVHGLGGSYLNWMLIGPLLAADHRVLAVDLAGFGLTPPAGRGTTVAANRDLLDDFCRAVAPDIPVILVGNSMGGLIVMMEAAANPERVAATVLIDPALPMADLHTMNRFTFQRLVVPMVPGVGEAAMRLYFATTTPEEQVEETLRTITADPSVVPAEARAASVELQRLRRGMEWSVSAFLAAARSTGIAIARRSAFRAMIHRITAPTLVIHGTQDRIVSPGSARWLVAQRPDWELRMFSGLGHVPMIERPEGVAETMRRWLTSTDSPAPAAVTTMATERPQRH
jgi:pimeloyl-ACP methyl ester carboxylesterase